LRDAPKLHRHRTERTAARRRRRTEDEKPIPCGASAS